MEFHHTQRASSTNGSLAVPSSVATDDLEIDAAQGGANKVSCSVLPHADHVGAHHTLPQRPHTHVGLGLTIQLDTQAWPCKIIRAPWLTRRSVPYGAGLPGTHREVEKME